MGNRRRVLQLGLCVLVAVGLAFVLPYRHSEPLAARMTAVTFVMAVLWVFEILPIPVTSLLPLVLLPADIGGMATPIGTPPNLVLLELHQQLLPDAPPISFAQWMALGLPISLSFLAAGWLLLTRVIFHLPRASVTARPMALTRALEELGPLRRDEKITGLVFAAAALAWLTGSDLHLGASFTVPGWRSALALPEVGDASVAVGAAALLFAIPSHDHVGEAIMTWDQTKEIPWGLLLLFGGGFALAGGFSSSGLSVLVGRSLGALSGVPVVVLVLVVCAVLTMLTEVTSNTATATLVLPILAGAAPGLGVHPMVLMVPATLSASCAFMMPVASPTQAIVFGSGYVSIREMVRAGIWFNVLGVVLVTLVFTLLGAQVFGLG